MAYYWMSFCDPHAPKGEQFLGVAIVEAADEASAVLVSGLHGCNPGGEIGILEILPEQCPVSIAAVKNKLHSRADLERLGLI